MFSQQAVPFSSALAVHPHDEQHRHKLYVGVDFGTTFTGLSWVNSTKTLIDEINVIRNWPGPSKEANEVWKTPSKMAYISENPKVRGMKTNAWGYSVNAKMKSTSWMKLLLDQQTAPTKHDADLAGLESSQGIFLQLPQDKSASEVCADYLSCIYKWAMDTLEHRLSREILKLTPIEFIFTVPAIWSDSAKAATERAAKNGGFCSRQGDELSLISEPEAAAIATLTALTQEISVRAGSGILICDCGGGTVDLTAYSVSSVQPLRLKELVVGEGGKCGSTFIDRQFFKWMDKTFTTAFKKVPFDKKGPGSKFMREFEMVKVNFGTSDDEDEEFEVTLTMQDVEASANYQPVGSSVIFTWADMKSFFDPVVARILGLIEAQIEKVACTCSDEKITTIILVGGFGDSMYLYNRIHNWSSQNDLQLLCPPNPQAAIVKGAALSALLGLRLSKRLCRRHYGFDWGLLFREGVDSEEDAYIDTYDGEKKCWGRMEWLIAKGTEITESTTISIDVRRPWSRGESRTFPGELYCCDLDVAPEHSKAPGAVKVGSIQIDFSKVPLKLFESSRKKGKVTVQFEYTLQVILGSKDGVLRFQTMVGKKVVGRTEIEYT